MLRRTHEIHFVSTNRRRRQPDPTSAVALAQQECAGLRSPHRRSQHSPVDALARVRRRPPRHHAVQYDVPCRTGPRPRPTAGDGARPESDVRSRCVREGPAGAGRATAAPGAVMPWGSRHHRRECSTEGGGHPSTSAEPDQRFARGRSDPRAHPPTSGDALSHAPLCVLCVLH